MTILYYLLLMTDYLYLAQGAINHQEINFLANTEKSSQEDYYLVFITAIVYFNRLIVLA